MPKYSLNVNLISVFEETPSLSITEICVLDYLRDICVSQHVKIREDRIFEEDVWTSVDYDQLLKEVPYLHLQSVISITNILKKLKENNFIDILHKPKNKTYIRLLERIDNLYTSSYRKPDSIPTQTEIMKKRIEPEYTEKELEIIEKLFNFYKKKINEHVRLTSRVKVTIYNRLKEYEPKELALAIKKFSNNSWRMENNSDKGLIWFFRSEDQIAKFLGLNEDREQERFNFVN